MTDELPQSRHDYAAIIDQLYEAGTRTGAAVEPWLAEWCKRDLFFLLRYGLKRKDCDTDWVFDRCREVQAQPNDRIDLWAREHYKDLSDDTPILTANFGWMTHGELRVGDLVYAPDGRPVPVQALSPRYTDSECYRLTFNDGATIVCGAGHLWRIKDKVRRRVAGSKSRRIEWSERVVPTHQLSVGDDVGVAAPLHGEDHAIPLDPYVLGAWLGDGTTGCPHITASFDDADDMLAVLQSRGVEAKRVDYDTAARIVLGSGVRGKKGSSDVVNGLRAAGVLHDKHIPAEYLAAPIEQRLALLSGLMDTDGHCNTRGTATFVNVNERLIDGVYELAMGLGLRPRRRHYSTYWQVSFQAHTDRNPFFMLRKALRARFSGIRREGRRIAKIERVDSVPTRCIQVEGGMYLAGRELIPTHNSTIITYALSIQDILNDPETTIGIFSHTRPIAKAFLKQIKREFETNEDLKEWFPDILYANPQNDSPKWSEDEGLIVKRKTNPKEATVEAWGVVDGMPTGKHFNKLVYDDLVTASSVTTPEMIEKTTEMLALSYNLGAHGGARRFIGTRYHFNDSYREVMARGTATPRIYAATSDGAVDGPPVFLTREQLAKKRADMGPYVFGCQMLQNPTADATQGFKEPWLQFASVSPKGHNIVLLFDPAGSKGKKSDYTAGWALGFGPDRNIYVHDMVRDRLNLTERAALYIAWHRKWSSMLGRPVSAVGIEQYGMMADIEYLKEAQNLENYRFEVTPLGGAMPKNERIRRLIPWFEKKRIFLPASLTKTSYEGRSVDLVRSFIDEEYRAFPVAPHDDMLDALARFLEPDLPITWPAAYAFNDDDEEVDNGQQGRNSVTGY